MGFTKKTAEEFFTKINAHNIDMLVDVRFNNRSQLAGFTKGPDLRYFLENLCGCSYNQEISFAPTKEILDDYKKNKISWEEYELLYNDLIEKRRVERIYERKYASYNNILFLCSEPTPECCHRRLLAEYIANKENQEICHI